MITSFPVHTFIVSALSAARTYEILPSYALSKEIFGDSESGAATDNLSLNRRTFRQPMAVSESLQENWKQRIRFDVVKARERRIQSQDVSISLLPLTTVSTHSGDRLGCSFEYIGDRASVLDNTFANVATEFHLNGDQRRAYYIFMDTLRSILLARPG
jgi:hypothetical protein